MIWCALPGLLPCFVRELFCQAVPQPLQTPVRKQYASGLAGSELVADVALTLRAISGRGALLAALVLMNSGPAGR